MEQSEHLETLECERTKASLTTPRGLHSRLSYRSWKFQRQHKRDRGSKNTETIREYVNRKPFEAFVLRLSNGEVYEVRHPENVMILKTRIVIGYPEVDRVVQVGLIHVNSIETLQSA